MIPNIIHFVFGMKEDFANKPFGLVHYLAIKSAIEINRPDEVFFYYQYMPTGYYWEKIKNELTLCQVNAPDRIYSNPVNNYAHKSDIIRLEQLYNKGGIYLDCDTICKKPFTDLLHHQCVLGEEQKIGLCNAVILAEPYSTFIRIWLNNYQSFNGDQWNEHSVILPDRLAKQLPSLIHVLPYDAFFYPIHWDVSDLFERVVNFNNAYIHHLWESKTWDSHLKNLTKNDVLTKDTTYNLIARKYL